MTISLSALRYCCLCPVQGLLDPCYVSAFGSFSPGVTGEAQLCWAQEEMQLRFHQLPGSLGNNVDKTVLE